MKLVILTANVKRVSFSASNIDRTESYSISPKKKKLPYYPKFYKCHIPKKKKLHKCHIPQVVQVPCYPPESHKCHIHMLCSRVVHSKDRYETV